MPKPSTSRRRKSDNVVSLKVVETVQEEMPVDKETVKVLYDLYQQALKGNISGLLYHVIHPGERYSNGVTGLIHDHPEHGVYGAARLLHLCNRALDVNKRS